MFTRLKILSTVAVYLSLLLAIAQLMPGVAVACEGGEEGAEVWKMRLKEGGMEITEMENGHEAELEITSPAGGGDVFAIGATPNPAGSFEVEPTELEKCFGVYGANRTCPFRPRVRDVKVGPSRLTFSLKAKTPNGIGLSSLEANSLISLQHSRSGGLPVWSPVRHAYEISGRTGECARLTLVGYDSGSPRSCWCCERVVCRRVPRRMTACCAASG